MGLMVLARLNVSQRIRIAAVTSGFLATLWLGAAFAADEPVTTARNLLDQKKAAEAYALLEPLEGKRAGEPDFDYWLGDRKSVV